MGNVAVLRFPITGEKNKFFLLEVSPHGSKALDLKLLGTDGEGVFLTKLRHRRIAEHKSSTGYCTDAEWEAILISTLVEQKPVHNIEIRADVPKDSPAICLSFRKNIQGITQKLGSIKFPERPKDDRDSSNDIQTFKWCVSLLGEREELQDTATTSAARITFLEHTVEQLKDQLQELIKVKEDDEIQLLGKFRDLLNEKKVKIRQQQRLLAAANVDVQALAKMEGQDAGMMRKSKPSRPAKRKGVTGDMGSSDDDMTSEAADAMDVDVSASPQLDPEPDERYTTDNETQDESSAESERERESEKPPRRAARPRGSRVAAAPSSQGAATTRTSRNKKSSPDIKAEPASQQSDDAPPAKRELPFMRNKKKAAPAPKPEPTLDDDETESDDEL